MDEFIRQDLFPEHRTEMMINDKGKQEVKSRDSIS
jgi:hypothetical protein